MPTSEMTLSIILINYNTRELLRDCLNSIQRVTGPLTIQVIVVDNASSDGSVAMVREVMPEATLIEPGRNTWFTGGNNLGLQVATGRYIFILNSDTVINPETLTTMVAYLNDHPKVGAISCQMRYLDGGIQSIGAAQWTFIDLLLGYTLLGNMLFSWRNRREHRRSYADWDRQSNHVVDVLPDSCLMAPLPLIKSVGGFDETMKLYFTEDDLCYRIRKAGYECHYVANTFIFHKEHASTDQVKRISSKVYFDDLIIFARKYFGPMASLLLQLLITPLRIGTDIAHRVRDRRHLNFEN